MAKTQKRRRLKNLNINEVSWVDRPANETPFLFIKNDSSIEKQFKGLDFEFSTKGDPDTTSLKINGQEVKNVKGASFWYAPMGEDDIGLMVEYTTSNQGENINGFSSTKTFRLSKSDEGYVEDEVEQEIVEPSAEDLEKINKFIGTEIKEADGNITKQLAENINIFNEYHEDLPPVLTEAIKSVTKLATEMEVHDNTPETKMEKSEEKTEPEAKEEVKPEPEVSNKDVLAAITGIATRLENVETKLAETTETKKEDPPVAEDEEVETSAADFANELATAVADALKQ